MRPYCDIRLHHNAVEIHRIDRPVPKHDVGSNDACTLKSFNHGGAEVQGPQLRGRSPLEDQLLRGTRQLGKQGI